MFFLLWGVRRIFAQTTIDAYHLVRRTSVDVGAQFIAPWWQTTPSQAGAMNCAPTSIITHHAKIVRAPSVMNRALASYLASTLLKLKLLKCGKKLDSRKLYFSIVKRVRILNRTLYIEQAIKGDNLCILP